MYHFTGHAPEQRPQTPPTVRTHHYEIYSLLLHIIENDLRRMAVPNLSLHLGYPFLPEQL